MPAPPEQIPTGEPSDFQFGRLRTIDLAFVESRHSLTCRTSDVWVVDRWQQSAFTAHAAKQLTGSSSLLEIHSNTEDWVLCYLSYSEKAFATSPLPPVDPHFLRVVAYRQVIQCAFQL